METGYVFVLRHTCLAVKKQMTLHGMIKYLIGMLPLTVEYVPIITIYYRNRFRFHVMTTSLLKTFKEEGKKDVFGTLKLYAY